MLSFASFLLRQENRKSAFHFFDTETFKLEVCNFSTPLDPCQVGDENVRFHFFRCFAFYLGWRVHLYLSKVQKVFFDAGISTGLVDRFQNYMLLMKLQIQYYVISMHYFASLEAEKDKHDIQYLQTRIPKVEHRCTAKKLKDESDKRRLNTKCFLHMPFPYALLLSYQWSATYSLLQKTI